ncbi:Zinc finger, RanBP2-type [Phytophthora cactorum]|nr:Zinc finger, RanBP2-type [Phytophthora cactorum]
MGNSESREASSSGSNSSRPVRRSLPPQSSIDSSDMAGPGIRDERRSASMPNEREVVATNRRHVPRPRPSRRHQNSSSSSSSDDHMQRERGGIERGQEATEEASSQLSYWYLIKHGYTELDRDEFSFVGRAFIREDFTVVNDRRQKLVARMETGDASHDADASYLHGNSRVGWSFGVLRTCLAAGLSVAASIRLACGKSDGEYISLGYYERDDLRDVVTYLRTKKNIGAVALWGEVWEQLRRCYMRIETVEVWEQLRRCYMRIGPVDCGIVVDSAFASLAAACGGSGGTWTTGRIDAPGFLVKIVLNDQIFAAYGGDKNLVKVDGDHNSSRPQFLLDSAAIFLQTALQVDATATAQLNSFADGITGGGGRVPWEGAVGRTSSLSMCSSPASSYRMTMDLDARYSGKNSMMVPMEPWSCPSCTFVNRPLSMQCEMCRNIYFPDDNDDIEDAGDEEDDALSSEAARRRALTTVVVRPPPAPTQSRGSRRRTLEAVPSPSPSFVSSTSAQRPAHSVRSVGVATVTTAATSVSSRVSSP